MACSPMGGIAWKVRVVCVAPSTAWSWTSSARMGNTAWLSPAGMTTALGTSTRVPPSTTITTGMSTSRGSSMNSMPSYCTPTIIFGGMCRVISMSASMPRCSDGGRSAPP